MRQIEGQVKLQMRFSNLAFFAFVLFGFVLTGSLSWGTGRPALNVGELVSDSDAVVVANVGEIRPVGPAEVNVGDGTLKGERYRTDVIVLYGLRGDCPTRFTVEFGLPTTSVAYSSVKSGIRILFVKKERNGTYAPASLYYPDLPAVAQQPPDITGGNPVDRVFRELGAVLASRSSSAEDKWEVLHRSYAVPENNKLFLVGLLTAVQSEDDPDLHRRIQAELISRNDISQLADVCTALLHNQMAGSQKQLVLYNIGERFRNREGLAELSPLLTSSDADVRVAAAQALWHIASSSSVGSLSRALHDSDPRVRYYAIRGLADATGQPQWGPGQEEYAEHEAVYLQHWLDWTRENSPK